MISVGYSTVYSKDFEIEEKQELHNMLLKPQKNKSSDPLGCNGINNISEVTQSLENLVRQKFERQQLELMVLQNLMCGSRLGDSSKSFSSQDSTCNINLSGLK